MNTTAKAGDVVPQNLEVLVEVLAVNNRSGISKGSGKPFSMEIAQCLVHGNEMLVGELILPKDHPVPQRGFYRAEFEVAVGFDKRIVGSLKALYPAKAPVVKPAAEKPF